MTENRNKLRAINIIWDFAEDYSLNPKIYDDKDLYYINMLQGEINKSFDIKIIESFIEYITKNNPYKDDIFFITKILFEDLAYKNLKEKSLTIENFRKTYAQKIYKKYTISSPKNIHSQIENAYYKKAIGKPITEGVLINKFYDDIFSINEKDTSEIVSKLNFLFQKYFKFYKTSEEKELFEKMVKEKKPKNFKKEKEQYSDEEVEDQFNIGSAEFNGNIYLEEKKIDTAENKLFFTSKDFDISETYKYIENFYGKSALSESTIKKLENTVSKEIHKDSHLYFSNGKYPDNPDANFHRKNRLIQEKKNLDYLKKNYLTINRQIKELQQSIKSSMQIDTTEDINRKDYGILKASDVWKAQKLGDLKIFYKNEVENTNRFYVDLLIDSSASQIGRENIISSQAYIIAKAMDLLNIPIRIMGYSTLKSYTIFNVYRDYNEEENNKKIFNFLSSGSNRDGFVFKTFHEIIKNSTKDETHILIILSDGKPHDEKIQINVGSDKNNKMQYKDRIAIFDSAKEIRKLNQDNISTLAVFTGEDEDVKNAKIIYGRNFAHIKNVENFSKIVSVFMKNIISES